MPNLLKSKLVRGALSGVAAFSVMAAGLSASALEPRSGVVLRMLDKITGNSTDLRAQIGERIAFGRLEILPRACHQAPPEDTPESVAFLEVFTNVPEERTRLQGGQVSSSTSDEDQGGAIFSGWMFASSPGLSALEHPTYDVWVISCSASTPE